MDSANNKIKHAVATLISEHRHPLLHLSEKGRCKVPIEVSKDSKSSEDIKYTLQHEQTILAEYLSQHRFEELVSCNTTLPFASVMPCHI